jgi:hypothetical protein
MVYRHISDICQYYSLKKPHEVHMKHCKLFIQVQNNIWLLKMSRTSWYNIFQALELVVWFMNCWNNEKVFMVVKIWIVVFWVMVSCSCRWLLMSLRNIKPPSSGYKWEYGSAIFLWNSGKTTHNPESHNSWWVPYFITWLILYLANKMVSYYQFIHISFNSKVSCHKRTGDWQFIMQVN